MIPIFSDASATTWRSVSTESQSQRQDYSIEQLHVHPGKAVKRGDNLCSLAYHADLYIEGTAFESDLSALKNVISNDWSVTAELGHQQSAGHRHKRRRDGLKLLHVNNHVDRQSQTCKFYLPLQNEVAQSTSDGAGRTFLQWQFKPGQRVHLRLPIERWSDQWIVPLAAIVIDGPNAFVFVEHVHEDQEDHPNHDDLDGHDLDGDHHDQDDDHDLGHAEVFIELEPVPVRLLHRDSENAVIADDGQVKLDDRIALNNAFKLYLAMQMQAGGGGGGGHHHHDH